MGLSIPKVARSKIMIAPAVIILILILLFVFRGWVRITVVPKTIGLFAIGKTKSTFDSENITLQFPLKLLGYKQITPENSGCYNGYAHKFSQEIFCSTEIQAYSKISDLSISPDAMKTNAAKIMRLLQQNGWDGSYNDSGPYTSLSKLIDSITTDIDYQPDATYTKKAGNTLCSFESHTAYSKPAPPAIGSIFFCTHTIDIFGNPFPSAGQPYQPVKP